MSKTASPGSLTHAGAVAYRLRASGVEYLLVGARSRPAEWVLPKGHIEAGESVAEAALREASEEGGVTGALRGTLGTQEFCVSGERVVVSWQLLEVEHEGPSPEARPRRWCLLEDALALIGFDDQGRLLREADARIRLARARS